MVLWFAASWLLTGLFRYDNLTAALVSWRYEQGGSGSQPGGADVAIVSFAQLIRLGTIVTVVPVFVALFFGES